MDIIITHLVSLADDATVGRVELSTLARLAAASRWVMRFVRVPVVGAISYVL